MPIVVPGVATNYPGPLKALTSPFARVPTEGNYQIPAEIDWGSMGGADHVVAFNLANSGDTKIISQLCSVRVDNSACGSDIQFIFPDSSETVTIPAYEPYVLIPLFTRALSFFVASGLNNQLVESTDFTRFTLFNFVPPPVTYPAGEEQQFAGNAAISTVVGTTTLVAAGKNGRVENVDITAQFPGQSDPSKTVSWELTDGSVTPRILAAQTNLANQSNAVNIAAYRQQNLALSFENGLYFKVIADTLNTDGTYSVNIAYRSP